MSSSERTSHSGTSGLETLSARSRTFFSIRSPWYVNASRAPSSARRFAIAHAIDRRLATPMTSAVLPSNLPGVATAGDSRLVCGSCAAPSLFSHRSRRSSSHCPPRRGSSPSGGRRARADRRPSSAPGRSTCPPGTARAASASSSGCTARRSPPRRPLAPERDAHEAEHALDGVVGLPRAARRAAADRRGAARRRRSPRRACSSATASSSTASRSTCRRGSSRS